MKSKSAWQRLEASLRRLKRLRELAAPSHLIENEIVLAKRHWSRVPPAPAGAELVWPEDIRKLAEELGFEPDTREAPAAAPTLLEQIVLAQGQYSVAAEIARAIEVSGAVQDVAVTIAGTTVVLTGSHAMEARGIAPPRSLGASRRRQPSTIG